MPSNKASTEAVDFDTDFEPPPPGRLSEEEFVAWCDRQEHVRAEWVNGKVIVMSPVSRDHSSVGFFLSRLLADYVERHDLGIVFPGEFAVRLETLRSLRVPDLMFIAREHEHFITDTYVDGPPDLAIEIVSRDSVARDWREKYLDYQAAGVREYWIIDQFSERFEAYRLIEKSKRSRFQRIKESADRVDSVVLPGFFVRPSWFWSRPLPLVREVLRELGVV